MSELFVIEGEAENWQEALRLTADRLQQEGCVKDDFYECCKKREEEYPTGLTENCPVAIPHTTKDHVIKQAICALRLRHPVMFQRMDDPDEQVEVKYVLNLALLDDSEHVEIIARVIRYLKDDGALKEMEAASKEDLEKLLKNKFLTAKGED